MSKRGDDRQTTLSLTVNQYELVQLFDRSGHFLASVHCVYSPKPGRIVVRVTASRDVSIGRKNPTVR